MARFSLTGVGNKDLQTTYRYELTLPASATLGLDDSITCFCTSVELPGAEGESIVAHYPMGRKGHQAGKSTTKPISLEFYLTTGGGYDAISLVEKWNNATYDLDQGTNIGKARYSIDNIRIRLIGERNKITKSWVLLRAQITGVDRGTVSAESTELMKVKMTLVYDDYKVYDGNGNQIRGVR